MGEVLRHLSETGAIYQDDTGRWTAAADLEEMALPDSVRAVIGSRVARLGDAVSQVLPLAAVIGRDFDLDLLARVTERTEDELLDLLDAADAVALVARSPTSRAVTASPMPSSSTPCTQDLGATRRARAHRQVAEAIEAIVRRPPRRSRGRTRPSLVQRHPTRQHRQGHQLRPPGRRGCLGSARP